MPQNRHGGRGGSFHPLVVRNRSVESELLVIISIDIPPVISLVAGGTISPTTAGPSSSVDATPVASSSKPLDKSTAAGSSSTSMNSGGGNSGSGSKPSAPMASPSLSEGAVAASITGMNYHPKQGHQPAGGRGNQSKLTCLASSGDFNRYSNVPSAATNNNFPGATAFTTPTPIGLTTDSSARALTTLHSSSGAVTGTTDWVPSSSSTTGGGARKGHSHLSREAIVGVVVALGVVLIGAIILAYRYRRRASRKDGSSATRAQDNLLGWSTTTTRSRMSNSSNEESGILSSQPPCTERKGSSTRSLKRPPDIIIHPSSLSSQHGQETSHSSLSPSASPDRSQYVLAHADSIIIDASRPPTPLSPLIVITATENYHPPSPSRTRSPHSLSATHFQNKSPRASFRPIDVDIPPIPPLPSSPPPVPPGSPSRPRVQDPFVDPPSPSPV